MSTGRFFDRTIPFWGFHGSSEVLQTLLVAPPSWIQDGGAGNDVNQDLGRPFRSPLWRWRKMAALPLPAAILDDLIPGPGNWEWGHPRWRPEAEGPPSCATATMGIEKAALYYLYDTLSPHGSCLYQIWCKSVKQGADRTSERQTDRGMDGLTDGKTDRQKKTIIELVVVDKIRRFSAVASSNRVDLLTNLMMWYACCLVRFARHCIHSQVILVVADSLVP